jgi:hypothetical protein
MSAMRRFVFAVASILVSGCGLYVPTIQDFGDTVTGQQLVQSIAYNVTCEVQDAVYRIYNNPDHPRKSTFLDTWGVQISLSLQVQEKGSTSPLVNWFPPSPVTNVFNLSAGGTLSADATRQEKLNSYYLVSQIRALGPCDPTTRPGGLLLMQSDLGLEEWLRSNVTAADTGVVEYARDYTDGPLKTNVISHEVKFSITNIGNLTPAWRMTRVLINQSGNFLSATRDRTNDLIITLGPTLPTPKPVTDKHGNPVKDASGRVMLTRGYVPSAPAAEAALASQIGLAVANAIRSTLQP